MSDEFMERRRHKRYFVNGIHGNVLYSSDMSILNISLGGAAIETTKSLEVNREYPFKIKYKGTTFNLRGRVVWSILSHSKKLGSEEVVPVYKVGVEFTNVLSEEANMLTKFIEENAVTTLERRLKGVRWKVTTPEDFKFEHLYKYDVKNISLSGMLIESDYPLDTNTRYTMELLLNGNVMNIVGRVTNCVEIESGNSLRYNIGIEFIEMSEKDRELLKNFLDTLEE